MRQILIRKMPYLRTLACFWDTVWGRVSAPRSPFQASQSHSFPTGALGVADMPWLEVELLFGAQILFDEVTDPVLSFFFPRIVGCSPPKRPLGFHTWLSTACYSFSVFHYLFFKSFNTT